MSSAKQNFDLAPILKSTENLKKEMKEFKKEEKKLEDRKFKFFEKNQKAK